MLQLRRNFGALWEFLIRLFRNAELNEPETLMKTISVSLIFAASALVATGEETPGNERPRMEMRKAFERKPDSAAIWKIIDKNKDGSISYEEFSAMPRLGQLPEDKRSMLFKRLDKDLDGQLSRREMDHMRKSPGGPDTNMRRLFELDKDRSGGISMEEFKSGELFGKLPPERLKALFSRLDTDGDGELTPKDRPETRRGPFSGRDPGEFRRGERPPSGPEDRKPQHRPDADGDGFVSFEEFRQSPEVRQLNEDVQEDRFEALDVNGDLKLSPEERSKATPPHRANPKPPGPRNPGPTADDDQEMMIE
jgi:Ca2+-binding EF-hand superfamily protein